MSAADVDQRNVLIVDDDDNIAAILEHVLESQGYGVGHARNGIEALEHIVKCTPDIVLLDLDMPGLGGLETCRRIKSDPRYRLLPIIIVTGRAPTEARLQAWELGADDYLTKPFNSADISARCRSLLRIKQLVDDLDSAQSVIFSLARAIEAKSRYTQGHTERVTDYAMELAIALGMSSAEQESLRHGAALHDIGKIAIPDDILNKPGRLTDAEFAVIRTHPVEGVHIVQPLHSIRAAIPMIRWHHERMDGTGYPDAIAGSKIPLTARIIAVADVFDALSSDRPYRPAMPLAKCLDELEASARSGGLDPQIVRRFCEIAVSGFCAHRTQAGPQQPGVA